MTRANQRLHRVPHKPIAGATADIYIGADSGCSCGAGDAHGVVPLNISAKAGRTMNNRLVIFVAIAMLSLPSKAFAQQYVSFGETGVSVELPDNWSPFKSWSLTENMPAVAVHHLQDQTTGQYIAVQREQCPDLQRRLSWARGELATAQLGSRVDSLTAISTQSAVTLEGSTGFVSMAARESVVYKSYAFFLAKGELCYRVEVGGPENLFESSSGMYQSLLLGLNVPE